MTEPEQRYYERLAELGCVGAGLGGGFENTNELHVMKYKEAMKTGDRKLWQKAVAEEHERMVKHDVFKAVKKKDLPPKAKVLTTTWAMKKKSNGKYRARLNARGFEQINGLHYDEDTKSSPVVSEATILIVLVLMLLAGWVGQDMLHVMRILESMGFKIKKPMLLIMDNKGAKDLINNWSVGGRTRHIEVRQFFLRELKEAGIIHCVWTAGTGMCSDLFTKNLPRQVYEKHAKVYVGEDEYMLKENELKELGNIQVEEGVGHCYCPHWYLEATETMPLAIPGQDSGRND